MTSPEKRGSVANREPVVEPMQWPGFQPTCHEYGCENDARWHVTFQHYEEYRCDEHKPEESNDQP